MVSNSTVARVMRTPALVVADGASGLWKAVGDLGRRPGFTHSVYTGEAASLTVEIGSELAERHRHPLGALQP